MTAGNTFSAMAGACGADEKRLNAAALLALSDRIKGNRYSTPEQYAARAAELERRFGYGLAAAALIAADWLDEPKPEH